MRPNVIVCIIFCSETPDGNGFKTSTMRLGADVIVFSRSPADVGRRHVQNFSLMVAKVLVVNFTVLALILGFYETRYHIPKRMRFRFIFSHFTNNHYVHMLLRLDKI